MNLQTDDPSQENQAQEMGELQQAKVAVVAPVWLNESLHILLQSMQDIQILTRVQTVLDLLAQALPAAPDLVLLDGKRDLEQVYEQVSQVKARWPGVYCIVLVDHIRQQKVLKMAGADLVLVKGLSPQRLREAVLQGAARSKPSTAP